MQPHQKRCPTCGQPCHIDAKICSCGHVFMPSHGKVPPIVVKPPTVPVVQAIDPRYSQHPIAVRCVRCGYNEIRSLRSVFSAGSATGNFGAVFASRTSFSGGGGASSWGGLGGTIALSSLQARNLGPPSRPQPPIHITLVVGILLLILGIPLILGSFLPSDDEMGIAQNIMSGFFGFGLTGVAIYCIRDHKINSNVRNANYQIEFQNWVNRLAVWEALYFCPRCDCVFDPLTNNAAPSHCAYMLLP